MRRWLGLLAVILFAFVPASCAPGLPEGGQEGPRVWIDAPLPGSSLALAPVEVVSHASHTGGIGQVELSVAGAVVAVAQPGDPGAGLVTSYHLWQPVAAGDYTLAVRASSREGEWGEYALAAVSVAGEITATAAPSATPTAVPPSATATPPLPSPSSSPSASAIPTIPAPTIPVVGDSTPLATPTASEAASPTPPPTASATATVYARPTLAAVPSTLTPRPRVVPVLPTVRIPPVIISKPSIGVVTTSVDRFYYDSAACGPKNVLVSVPVTDPAGVAAVDLHLRLVAKGGASASAWTSLPMAASDGAWTTLVEGETHLPDHASYHDAWVEFYVAAANKRGGTSQSVTYTDDLSLTRCIVVR